MWKVSTWGRTLPGATLATHTLRERDHESAAAAHAPAVARVAAAAARAVMGGVAVEMKVSCGSRMGAPRKPARKGQWPMGRERAAPSE